MTQKHIPQSLRRLACLSAFISMAALSSDGAIWNEFENLDDNQLPDGWSLNARLGNVSLANGRLNGFVSNAAGELIRTLPALGTVSRVELEWDGNLNFASSGMGSGAGIDTFSGKHILVSHGHSNFNNPGVSLVQIAAFNSTTVFDNSTTIFNATQSAPMDFDDYRYTMAIESGSIRYRAVSLSTSAQLFDIEYSHPSIEPGDAAAAFFSVYATSGSSVWVDNPRIRVTSCDADIGLAEQLAEAQAAVAAISQQLTDAQSANAGLTAQVTALQDTNQSLNQQLAASEAANGLLQQQLAASEAANTALAAQVGEIQTQLDRITDAMRREFTNAAFAIPGLGPVAQVTSLADAIIDLSHGQMQHVYRGLGGR